MGMDSERAELSKTEMMQLIDRADCAMFTVEPGTDITVLFANKKFYSIIQYTPAEFKKEFGNRTMELVIPEEKQQVRNLIARQTAFGGVLHLEYRIKRKDGMVLWVSLTAEMAKVDGNMLYYCSVQIGRAHV